MKPLNQFTLDRIDGFFHGDGLYTVPNISALVGIPEAELSQALQDGRLTGTRDGQISGIEVRAWIRRRQAAALASQEEKSGSGLKKSNLKKEG